MVAPTAQDIKDVFDGVNDFPYIIRVFTYVPKYPLFPYIVIRKTPPIQTDKNITTETFREGFEITLYIRYTRNESDEESDQLAIEKIILRELEKIDFGTKALYLETKNWQRTAIPRLYGSQSRITVLVVDKSSVSGEGILGSETSLTLPSGQKVIILALTSTEGTNLEPHQDDVAIIRRDFSGIEQGDFTMEYESTPNRDNEIKTLSEAAADVNVTFVKKGSSRNVSILFGNTNKRGQFDNIERATTRFVIQAVNTIQTLTNFKVDAVLA